MNACPKLRFATKFSVVSGVCLELMSKSLHSSTQYLLGGARLKKKLQALMDLATLCKFPKYGLSLTVVTGINAARVFWEAFGNQNGKISSLADDVHFQSQ